MLSVIDKGGKYEKHNIIVCIIYFINNYRRMRKGKRRIGKKPTTRADHRRYD